MTKYRLIYELPYIDPQYLTIEYLIRSLNVPASSDEKAIAVATRAKKEAECKVEHNGEYYESTHFQLQKTTIIHVF